MTGGWKEYAKHHAVPITFVALCLALCFLSRQSPSFLLGEILTRLARNSFTTLSLIIPVLAGLGLNFGIVLGAMAAQMAIVIVITWKLTGFAGFALAVLLSVPLSLVFGWLVAVLFNQAKGREMVTGLIAGFFSNGLYQFVFLFLVGTLIPFKNADLLLPEKVGLRNTVNLESINYALDDLASVTWKPGEGTEFVFGSKRVESDEEKRSAAAARELSHDLGTDVAKVVGAGGNSPIKVPFVTFGIIALLCAAIRWIMATKLGQDMRAVGQDMHIAEVAGIPVDRTRSIAVIVSTVLAAWGHLIYLQNMGTLNTYSSHEQIGMFGVASLLVGGASVTRATVWQALLGTLLFHTLFVTSPIAGKNLMGDPQIGEFFRVFVAYGVIALALALHAWKGRR